MLLLHVNMLVHMSHATTVAIQQCGFQELCYPTYHPDLASNDYSCFQTTMMESSWRFQPILTSKRNFFVYINNIYERIEEYMRINGVNILEMKNNSLFLFLSSYREIETNIGVSACLIPYLH